MLGEALVLRERRIVLLNDALVLLSEPLEGARAIRSSEIAESARKSLLIPCAPHLADR
jgi:hypothetical protein